MKRTHLLLLLILIFSSTNTAFALMTEEAVDMQYKVNHSDTIIVGNVTDVDVFYGHTIVTVEVEEWLKNPLPTQNITILTYIGHSEEVEDEVSFTENETAILMLRKDTFHESMFRVVSGPYGKHPVSDKDVIVRELGVGNETTEDIPSNETTLESESENETDEAIPFIGLAGMSIATLGAFLLLRKYD